jgi:hypothetical protein
MCERKIELAMKRASFGILATVLLVGTWVTAAQTAPVSKPKQDPLLLGNTNQSMLARQERTAPEIAVSSRVLDFGSIPFGRVRKLSFTVQNVGGGLLTGAATVSAPFSILTGNSYSLQNSQTQIITVEYSPDSLGIHMAVVHLTGGDGSAITVMGSVKPQRMPPRPGAPNTPGASQNLRLLAAD